MGSSIKNIIHKKTEHYSIKIDCEDGSITEIIDLKGKYHKNLISLVENHHFGRIFNRVKENDEYIPLVLKYISQNRILNFSDETGKNQIKYILNENHIEIYFTVDPCNSIRTGLELDFNFVNTPGLSNGDDMIIPSSPNMEKSGEPGFYLMPRTSGRHLVLVFPDPLACWRLKYSDFGHHLLGFQLLLSLSDLKYSEGQALTKYCQSSVKIGFAGNIGEAYDLVSKLGRFPVATAPFFGCSGQA